MSIILLIIEILLIIPLTIAENFTAQIIDLLAILITASYIIIKKRIENIKGRKNYINMQQQNNENIEFIANELKKRK